MHAPGGSTKPCASPSQNRRAEEQPHERLTPSHRASIHAEVNRALALVAATALTALCPRGALADELSAFRRGAIEAAPERPRFTADPVTDFGLLSLSVGFSGLLEAIINTGELRPQQPTDPGRLLWIDRPAVRAHYSSTASALSNVGVITAGAYALAAPILTGLRDGAQAGLVDGIIYAESAAFTWAATDLAKLAVRRPRPAAYQRQAELNAQEGKDAPSITETDSALSFFSGHAAETAAISATATYIAFVRSPNTVRPWVTLIVGSALTAFVSYERVAAGRHFPTDVIAGAMAGAGIGVLVPHLHRDDAQRYRPVWVCGGPSPGGASLTVSGSF